jgi:mRNA interferase MazF
MPTTIGFDFGDIVLVPFPFTDQTRTKRRPAVVVSSNAYHQQRADLILMAVTSQVRSPVAFGEMVIDHWQKAGLLKPGVVKPVMTTVEKRLVLRKLGELDESDRGRLLDVLRRILG